MHDSTLQQKIIKGCQWFLDSDSEYQKCPILKKVFPNFNLLISEVRNKWDEISDIKTNEKTWAVCLLYHWLAVSVTLQQDHTEMSGSYIEVVVRQLFLAQTFLWLKNK